MKLTNNHNLPDSFYNAVLNDDYDPGESDITVTSLMKPPRIGALEKKHHDDIEEDCSDRVWALLGTSVHYMLERGAHDDAIVEKRFYGDFHGWKVGGQIDHYHKGTLTDYKVTSAYVLKGHIEGEKTDWHEQMNANAELMRIEGHDVKNLEIICILRDWSKNKYMQELKRAKDMGIECSYPASQIQVYKVPMWTSRKCVEWIEGRVLAHQEALEQLPECSMQDRWEDPTKYALMKKGNKRAIKLFDYYGPAQMYAVDKGFAESEYISEKDDLIINMKSSHYIEERIGEPKRCLGYCRVADFCEQFKAMMGGKNE